MTGVGVRRSPLCGDDVVVIADDEMFSRFMVAEYLQKLGNPRVLAARDGEDAIAVLNGEQARHVRLVILDFNMPGRNGIEVLKEIRCGRLAVASDVMVVMVTGAEAWGLVAAALALDVDAFLRKPVSLAELRAHLDELEGTTNQTAPPAHYTGIDIGGLGSGAGLKIADFNPEQLRTVAVDELKEGMIIAEDLVAPKGVLIVANGSVVSERMARLLRGLTATGLPMARIQVACPTAAPSITVAISSEL